MVRNHCKSRPNKEWLDCKIRGFFGCHHLLGPIRSNGYIITVVLLKLPIATCFHSLGCEEQVRDMLHVSWGIRRRLE